MRLTAIELENFKGVGERQRIPIAPITLLFGPNSAGKSTVLQALHYLREIIDRKKHKINMVKLNRHLKFMWNKIVGDWLDNVMFHDGMGDLNQYITIDEKKHYDNFNLVPNINCRLLDHRLNWLRFRKSSCTYQCICRGINGPYSR